MKITIVSDLHLEWSPITITNSQNADVLILSGDILLANILHAYPYNDTDEDRIYQGKYKLSKEFRRFLLNVSLEFKHVIYVAGNHEFYNSKWNSALIDLQQECDNYHNIHFLECGTVTIDDTTFIGGTLWTNCNKKDDLTIFHLRSVMQDFRLIRHDNDNYRKITPIDTVIRHDATLKYFTSTLETVKAQHPNNKIVIVSHHSPSHLSIHPRYKNDPLTNGGYHSDLSEFILDHPEIVLWTHGHTHSPFDYTIGNTRIVCNPRGYETETYKENTDWNPNLLIEI